MSSLYRNDFTVENGIEIQTGQLAHWQKILNKESYLLVLAEVAKQNKKEMKWGYDVFRGNSIDTFIHNLYK